MNRRDCLLNFICAIPFLVAVNGILGNLIVLYVAWDNGLVNPTEQFPSLSVCGDQVPASCFFSQVCNIGCILGLVFEVMIYSMKPGTTTDTISLAFGIISSLGLSITGNFQTSVFPWVHYISAVLAFVGGEVYLAVNIYAKDRGFYKLCGHIGLAIYGVLLLTFVILMNLQLYHYAAIIEWTTVIVFFMMYFLFHPELRKFRNRHSKNPSAESDTEAEGSNMNYTAIINEEPEQQE